MLRDSDDLASWMQRNPTMLKTLIKRLIGGGGMGAAWAAGLLFLPSGGLFAALLICSSLCQWEFYKLAMRGGYIACRWIGLVLGGLWLAGVFAHGQHLTPHLVLDEQQAGLFICAGTLFLLVRLLFDPRCTRHLEAAAVTILGIVYVPFLLGYYIRVAQWGAETPFVLTRGGVFLAFYASLIVKMADVGAYFIGMWLGRHKMFLRISPGKSWEGLFGGLFFAMAFSVAAIAAAHSLSWIPATPLTHVGYTRAVFLGLLFGGISVIGDLVESMFKRAVNAKDSSGILPGVGGLLDVFDSLLFAPALMYFILPFLQP